MFSIFKIIKLLATLIGLDSSPISKFRIAVTIFFDNCFSSNHPMFPPNLAESDKLCIFAAILKLCSLISCLIKFILLLKSFLLLV